MGFHVCQWCIPNGMGGTSQNFEGMQFSPFSSADVTLYFPSQRLWSLPHNGLLHYVTEHNYLPPDDFINDVMGGEGVPMHFAGTMSVAVPVAVGYLEYPDMPTGTVPVGFIEKLLLLIQQAQRSRDDGSYRQTRGG